MSNWAEVDTFDGAIDYLMNYIGKDFEKALMLAGKIVESPTDFTGPQAKMTATKLAVYRLKIGQAAQMWKNKCVGQQNRQDKLVKDALMACYDGLLEVINTLKIDARQDHELTK